MRAFRPSGSPLLKVSFYAYGTLRYGVLPWSAGLDADGPREILTGPGPGAMFGPHVRGWNYDGVKLDAMPKVSFYAYQTLRYGVGGSAGEMDADGFEEILTAPGPGAVLECFLH